MTEKISVNVPQAARKQIREAERLMRELNARPGESPPPAAATGDAPAPDLPSVGVQVPADARPAPPAAPPASAEPAQAAPPAEDFKHKYDVLAGKYNAETQRLVGHAQALKAENDRLLQMLAAQQGQPASQPAQVVSSAITQKEREEYGEELISLIDRIATAKSQGELARLNTELNQIKDAVRVTVTSAVKSAQERVYEALANWNPEWERINVSQQFIDWLDSVDIISGIPRKSGLVAAFEAGDAQRVVGIFRRYVEEDSRSRSTAAETPKPAVDAATLITPGTPRGSAGEAPSGQQSGKIWSEQEINDFYSRVQRKRVSPEERTATEAEIQKAIAQGRVRPDRDDRNLSNRM